MVGGDAGAIGEVRLFLMAALLMIDEMQDLRSQLGEAASANARMNAGVHEMERKAAFAIADAAARLERLMGAS